MVVAKRDINKVGFRVDEKESSVILWAEDANSDRAQVAIPLLDSNCEGLYTAFDGNFLRDAITHSAERVRLSFGRVDEPFMFTNGADPMPFSLLMTMKA